MKNERRYREEMEKEKENGEEESEGDGREETRKRGGMVTRVGRQGGRKEKVTCVV
jgi:hypothetical protein